MKDIVGHACIASLHFVAIPGLISRIWFMSGRKRYKKLLSVFHKNEPAIVKNNVL